ncbi:MAG: hypothetical protein ABIS20_05265 [Thermoanaerobaculia bacterium]
MADTFTVEQLRSKLEEKRARLKTELGEIEEGLADLARLVSLAGRDDPRTQGEKPVRPFGIRVANMSRPAKPSAPRELAGPEPREEGLSDMFLEAAEGKTKPFDVRLKAVVNSKHGLNLDDKQASNALRNLLKRGKIKLIRAGGPRKPALYANLEYEAPVYRAVSPFDDSQETHTED